MISGESIFSIKVSRFQSFKVSKTQRYNTGWGWRRRFRWRVLIVQLLVWQKAKALAVRVYKETDHVPRSETYGLTSQIRRAAVSVPSNIAEGQGRLTPGEFHHFLGQARGSLLELETQFAIAGDLNYLPQQHLESLDRDAYEVLGLLNRLIDSLRKPSRAAAS